MNKLLVTILCLMTTQAFAANSESASGAYSGASASIYSPDVPLRTAVDVHSVPSVTAPALVSTLSGVCAMSTTAGVSFIGFGASGGSTWVDVGCERRLNANQLTAIGFPEIAKELMCDDKAVRLAAIRAGKPCFGDNK